MAIDELQRLLQEAYVRMDAESLRAMRPFGLTPTMLTILTQLECSQGKRLVDLTNATLVDASTLTRLIDRLERAALVQRTSDPDDRRAQRVILTPTGRDQRTRAVAAHAATLGRELESLDAHEQRQLVGLLSKLCIGLRRMHGEEQCA